jgi:hypothetical protein
MLTAKAMLRHHGCGRPNRFGSVAKKVVVAGEAFPSGLEGRTWGLLLRLVEAGYYRDLARYPSVELLPGLRWKVDFTMVRTATGEREYAEAKGVESERYKVLIQVWRTLGPGKLTIYKADRRGNPYVAEEIIPKGAP